MRTLRRTQPVVVHAPVPQGVHARIAVICAEKGITLSEFLFHATNAYSRKLGMPGMDGAVMDGFKPYGKA